MTSKCQQSAGGNICWPISHQRVNLIWSRGDVRWSPIGNGTIIAQMEFVDSLEMQTEGWQITQSCSNFYKTGNIYVSIVVTQTQTASWHPTILPFQRQLISSWKFSSSNNVHPHETYNAAISSQSPQSAVQVSLQKKRSIYEPACAPRDRRHSKYAMLYWSIKTCLVGYDASTWTCNLNIW